MGKITSKQVFGVVALIGVLACLLVYMNVFTKYQDETEALKASNAQLQTEVDDLKQYYDNMETYRADTKKMVDNIPVITADYPGDAKEEDAIMMAVNMQSVAILNYDKINIAGSEIIKAVPADIVTGAEIEGMDGEIDFVHRRATYSNQTTYANLKNAIAKVYESNYRIGVNAVSFKKESEDNNYIKGTIDITYYSLRGMGKPYTYPNMPSYFGGASDLFGAQHWALDEEELAEVGMETEIGETVEEE